MISDARSRVVDGWWSFTYAASFFFSYVSDQCSLFIEEPAWLLKYADTVAFRSHSPTSRNWLYSYFMIRISALMMARLWKFFLKNQKKKKRNNEAVETEYGILPSILYQDRCFFFLALINVSIRSFILTVKRSST